MKLSVIMPVHSEQETISEIISGLKSLVDKETLYEVILIIAGISPKETLDICKRMEDENEFVKMRVQKDKGFGMAYREAFKIASGDFVLMLDSDGEFNLNTIPKMIQLAKTEKYDLIQASRWIKGGGVEGYPIFTYIANRLFQYIFRAILLTKIHDLTFGYKMIRKSVIDSIKWEGIWHELAMETTIKPIKYGYRAVEVPSFWRKRRDGQSKNPGLMRIKRYTPFALKIAFSKYGYNTLCVLCGKSKTKLLNKKGILKKGGPILNFNNVICENCGLVFIAPQPKESDYKNMYEEYENNRHNCKQESDIINTMGDFNNNKKGEQIYNFLKEYLQEGKEVLDIGCGFGHISYAFNSIYGCNLSAIEPSKLLAETVGKKLGIGVFNGQFDDFYANNYKKFNVLIMHHVFEHFTNPIEKLNQFKNLLFPDGVIYIEVPNIASFKKPVNHFFDYMHPYNYSPKTLKEMIGRGGYKIIKINKGKKYRIQLVIAPKESAHKDIGDDKYFKKGNYFYTKCFVVARKFLDIFQ